MEVDSGPEDEGFEVVDDLTDFRLRVARANANINARPKEGMALMHGSQKVDVFHPSVLEVGVDEDKSSSMSKRKGKEFRGTTSTSASENLNHAFRFECPICYGRSEAVSATSCGHVFCTP